MKKCTLYKILLGFLLLIPVSCTPNIGKNLDNRDADLYDRIGYRPGYAPLHVGNDPGVKVVPDYYYRQADKKPVPSNRRAVKRRVNIAPVQYEPSSRYYNNPYSLKPPLNFPYFDSDQYYVPPKGGNGNGYHHEGPDRREDLNKNNNNLY